MAMERQKIYQLWIKRLVYENFQSFMCKRITIVHANQTITQACWSAQNANVYQIEKFPARDAAKIFAFIEFAQFFIHIFSINVSV